MKIEWDTPVDALTHGSNIRYIDLDEDEIMHWKYIKREKLSNGKYRYYYDWDQLKNDVGVNDWRETERQKLKYNIALSKYHKTNRRVREYEKATANMPAKNYDHDRSHKLYIDSNSSRDVKDRAYYRYISARSKLMSKPLGSVYKMKETVGKGSKAVSRWLSRVFNNEK